MFKRKLDNSPAKIVVGLGNPGAKYAQSFHNLGFLTVERLALRLGLRFKTVECKAVTAVGFINGYKVVVAKPQTYMNLSGESVRELLGRYKASPSDMLVVYDDIDIPRAAIRIRKSGSGGTHNGMRSILHCLQDEGFPRVRIGAGSPPAEIPLGDYVLMSIPEQWHGEFNQSLDDAAAACEAFLRGEALDVIMQKFNRV